MNHAKTRERLARRFFRIARRGCLASLQARTCAPLPFEDLPPGTQQGWRHFADHVVMRGFLVLSPK
jgi:hypothetical protein